jgi:hypothetical protein
VPLYLLAHEQGVCVLAMREPAAALARSALDRTMQWQCGCIQFAACARSESTLRGCGMRAGLCSGCAVRTVRTRAAISALQRWRMTAVSVQLTGAYRRRAADAEAGDDRMMEASAAEIRREEARSRRLGRQEDAQAEAEEAARMVAKAARKAARKAKVKKKRKKPRTGVSAFLADEASEDSDDDDSEYDDD